MLDNNIAVSIIMPVYKVEEYVGKAIESIQAQTLQNFEFLIVDDGTPDRSGEICDSYAAKDSRITVIHKENGGAPSARNTAIKKARGKYMYFMDSDDWAEPTMLEDMVRLAEENDRQLVIAGFYIDTYYNESEKFSEIHAVDDQIFATRQDFRKYSHKLFDVNLLYTPWNKLILSEYILQNNILFPETFWDDFPFNLSVVRDVERVAVTSKPYYHFIRKRAESETAKYRSDMYDKREEEHGWMVELYEHWGISNAEIDEFLARRYVERLVGCIENVTNKSCTLSSKEKKAHISRMIKSERAKQSVKLAVPKSKYMKLMLLPIKWQNTFLTYLEGKVISFVKSGNTKVFAKLKANR